MFQRTVVEPKLKKLDNKHKKWNVHISFGKECTVVQTTYTCQTWNTSTAPIEALRFPELGNIYSTVSHSNTARRPSNPRRTDTFTSRPSGISKSQRKKKPEETTIQDEDEWTNKFTAAETNRAVVETIRVSVMFLCVCKNILQEYIHTCINTYMDKDRDIRTCRQRHTYMYTNMPGNVLFIWLHVCYGGSRGQRNIHLGHGMKVLRTPSLLFNQMNRTKVRTYAPESTIGGKDSLDKLQYKQRLEIKDY